MAIITTENDEFNQHGDPWPHPVRKYVSHEGIFKTNIIRQGISGWAWRVRHRGYRRDPKTPEQLAYRAVMIGWMKATSEYREGHDQKDFFAVNVPRVLAGLPIIY
jgi:hypothetical protein